MQIKSAKLINGKSLSFGDFNVFVGGNGVGKTTIISELFHKTTDTPKSKYWWIQDATYGSINPQEDLDAVYKSLSRKHEGANIFWFSQAVKDIHGNVNLADDARFSSTERDVMRDSTLNPEFYNTIRFRRPFISFSSCESRLNLPNESNITRLDQPPQDPINVLSRNKTLLNEIDQIVFEIYKTHFVLLSHVGVALQIGIAKEIPPLFDTNANSQQDEFEKIESWKQENFTPITEAGHGIRSMIRLLTSLLEPVNQIILIDEPEMHIYPSQKRWLGKQLVSLARKSNKQVFLVTHDPMILQGILDENTKTNIFRIDRDLENKGIINACELDHVRPVHTRNQDQYLQGLFYQRSVVVEGANDRGFYQRMFEENPVTSDKDLGVIVAGSVSHSKHVVDIASKVKLKAAFIYDLDVLFQNISLIKDIYITLGGEGNPLEQLEAAYDEDEIVKGLVGDEKSKQIKISTGFTRRTGFSAEWLSNHSSVLELVFETLGQKGIFIVPNGTLESWASNVEESARFAENAPEVINANVSLKKRFEDFSKKVLSFLDIHRDPPTEEYSEISSSS